MDKQLQTGSYPVTRLFLEEETRDLQSSSNEHPDWSRVNEVSPRVSGEKKITEEVMDMTWNYPEKVMMTVLLVRRC